VDTERKTEEGKEKGTIGPRWWWWWCTYPVLVLFLLGVYVWDEWLLADCADGRNDAVRWHVTL